MSHRVVQFDGMERRTRTIAPARVGLGVCRVGDDVHALMTIEDIDGDTLDIVLSKAALGEILAHGDEVRRRIPEVANP